MKTPLSSLLCILFPLFSLISCCYTRLAVYDAATTKAMPGGTAAGQEASQTSLIDFGSYGGGILLDKDNRWYLPGYKLPVLEDGEHTIDVARIGQSAFTFSVKGGRVEKSEEHKHEAATVTDDGRLKLNTVPVTIIPGAYGDMGGRCFLPTHFNTSGSREWITGEKTFNLMPGLVYAIDNGCTVGGSTGASYFSFMVKGDGNVLPCPAVLRPSPFMAQGAKNELRLHAGRVKITTPTNDPGAYTVGETEGFGYSGAKEEVAPVILGLITKIQRKGGSPAYFCPYYGNRIKGKVTSGGATYNWEVVP